MALVIKDRVKETTTTTGTGTVTLAGAVSGFQGFSAIGNGNSTYYVISDPATGDWEVGIGTYTSSGTTLSRTTILSSSNAGSAVSFAAGIKDVFVSYPSSRAVYQNEAGNATVQGDFGTINATTANLTAAALTTGTISTTPSGNTDIVNKSYVDTLAASGIHFHQPVRVESPINLNATYNNGTSGVGATLTNAGTQAALVVDGVTVSVNDRVLVYEQTTQTQNGIYVVTSVGSGSTNWVLTRSSDADTYVINSANGLSEGSTVFVQEGSTGAGETYTCNTSGVITFGTTNITFAQISSAQIYSAGTGLTLSGTQFSITNTGTAGTYGSASAVPVFTTNAQGQVTSVTNTAIAITGAAVSGNIAGQAGSVANALTAGTFLTSGGTYNGSAARTFAVDATSANTASKVVARDASGNFSAGTITATLSGAATSATTATNLAGGAANRIAYQTGSGTTNFAVAPTVSSTYLFWNGSAFAWGAVTSGTVTSITAGTYLTGGTITTSGTIAVDATSANTASKVVARDASGNFSAGTITATLSGNATSATTATTATQVANALTAGTYLTSAGTFTGAAARTFAVDATDANTASKVVARDASGNFSAGTITASLNGNATTSSSTSGNAATATALQNARTLWGQSFNGTANITGALSSVTTIGMSGQLTNTLAIGTAPMVITSTTRVANLNVATAGTADTLTTARTINGVSFNGSANITVTANTTNTLTLGSYLTGTSFNGSSAVTAAVDATTTNTASKVVARDASGNFAAGTITAALSGNATTATTATNATNVAVTTSTTASAFKVPFANTTASTTGNYGLLQDSTATFTYNPSTNVLTVGTVSGALSGNATTATTATNIAGGAAGSIPYNTGSGTTAFVAAGTSGQILQSNGTSAPTFVNNTAASKGYVQAINLVFGF